MIWSSPAPKLDFFFTFRNNAIRPLYNMNDYSVNINCSPVGTYPNTEDALGIPFEFITEKILLFDYFEKWFALL